MVSQSPLTSASFLARVHPLTWRSSAIASVMRGKWSDQTSRTGRRVGCVTVVGPGIVFRDTPREVISGRSTDVERSVGTAEHVDKSSHRMRLNNRRAAFLLGG